MSDFATAFQQGLHAFQDVERARTEIDDVLEDFSAQVFIASAQKVHVRCDPPLKAATKFSPAIMGSNGLNSVPLQSGRALMAHPSTSSDEGVELCRYILAPSGYPVRLRYSDTETVCGDRDELIVGLQQLLADPWAGGVFSRVMQKSATAAPGS